MKSIHYFRILGIAFLLMASFDTVAYSKEEYVRQSQPNTPTIQATTALRIRSIPSIGGDHIGTLSTGETRSVTGMNANGLWLQIDYDGRVGWVCAEYTIDNGLLEQVSVTDQSHEDCAGNVTVLEAVAPEVVSAPREWNVTIEEMAFASVGEFTPGLMKFSPDGTKLFVHTQGEIQVLELPGLNLIDSYASPNAFSLGTPFDVSQDGRFLYMVNFAATNQSGETVQVWDLDNHSLVREFALCDGFVWCQNWSLNTEALLGAVWVSLQDRSDIRATAAVTGGGVSNARAAQHPDPTGIVVFDLTSGEQIGVFDISDLITNAFQDARHLNISQDGGILTAEVSGVGIVVWDLRSRERLVTLEGMGSGYAISPDGRTLAFNEGTSTDDGYVPSIRLVDVQTGETITIVGTLTDGGFSQVLEFMPDGQVFVSMHNDAFIRLWSIAERVLIAELDLGRPGGRESTLNFDGSLLATSHNDGSIRLFSIVALEQIEAEFEPTQGCIDYAHAFGFSKLTLGGRGVVFDAADLLASPFGQTVVATVTEDEQFDVTNGPVCSNYQIQWEIEVADGRKGWVLDQFVYMMLPDNGPILKRSFAEWTVLGGDMNEALEGSGNVMRYSVEVFYVENSPGTYLLRDVTMMTTLTAPATLVCGIVYGITARNSSGETIYQGDAAPVFTRPSLFGRFQPQVTGFELNIESTSKLEIEATVSWYCITLGQIAEDLFRDTDILIRPVGPPEDTWQTDSHQIDIPGE